MTDPDMPLDLVLHTPGGVVLAALQIAKAVREHKGIRLSGSRSSAARTMAFRWAALIGLCKCTNARSRRVIPEKCRPVRVR
jgi:hypothetical protein